MGPVRLCFGFALVTSLLPAQGTIVAGRAGIQGFDGDNKPAAAALISLANFQNKCGGGTLEQTSRISVDANGNIYFADSGNHRIRRIDPAGVITTAAGTGEGTITNALCEPSGAVGDGAAATTARLLNPSDVVMHPSGNLLIVDQQNNRIRQVSREGTVTTIVGSGMHNIYAPGVPANLSPMDWPSAIALDAAGTLYFAEMHSNRIGRVVDGRLSTVAGRGLPLGFGGDGGPAIQAGLSKPAGIAFDPAGNLLIADTGNHRIRRVSNGVITTMAGNGRAEFCGDGGPAAQSCLNSPMDVKADAAGNIYIADTQNNRVRKIDTAGNISTVVQGLNMPCAIALDAAGDLYIVDWQNYVIRKVSTNAVVNAASFEGAAAPGGYISIFGEGLAASTAVADRVPLPRELAGVSVEVNGVAAPLHVVSPGQINVQVPYETAPGPASAVLIANGARRPAIPFTVAAVAAGIFAYAGTTRAIAANQDGVLNSPETPESRGRALVFYVTGLGAVNPPVPTGEAAPLDRLAHAAPVTATVGGLTAKVDFAGLTPGSVGLGQVNLIIPENAPTGDAVPVIIQGSKAATVSIR
jgi:uncharacterized protein (TIGR03437 family)